MFPLADKPCTPHQLVPASVQLKRLHGQVSGDEVAVGSVLARLDRQSFGLVLLLLSIVAVVPGVCTLAGLLIAILGFEMVLGRQEPYFPQWIAARRIRTRRIRPVVESAISVLRLAETLIHPRWFRFDGKVKRLVGLVILLASVRLILVPLPFSNILPALVLSFVSLAYVEEDGLFLVVSIAVAIANLAFDSTLVRGIALPLD